jgi:transcriptional regulator
MYIPKTFEVTDSSTLHQFIETYSFGTLVTVAGEQPIATRLPLILDRTSGRHGRLLGHVARANPQWRSFDGNRQCLAMFDGPHAYVSPSWYATSPAVPTWNYATVHVYGIPRAIHDAEQLTALVDKLVGIYEAGMAEPWPGKLPADFKASMLKAIVGFAIEIDRIEANSKWGRIGRWRTESRQSRGSKAVPIRRLALWLSSREGTSASTRRPHRRRPRRIGSSDARPPARCALSTRCALSK